MDARLDGFRTLAQTDAPTAPGPATSETTRRRKRAAPPVNVDREMKLAPDDRTDHLARIEKARAVAALRWTKAEKAAELTRAAYARLGNVSREELSIEADAWELVEADGATAEAIEAHRKEALEDLGAEGNEEDLDVVTVQATHDLARDLLELVDDDAYEVKTLLGLNLGESEESPGQARARFAMAAKLRALVNAYAAELAAYLATYPADERDQAEEALRDLVFGEES
jgi:hypothetical protein